MRCTIILLYLYTSAKAFTINQLKKDNMIEAKDITFRYKRKTVFKDFSCTFGSGKVYGLLGKNGAGKSTLLYLITGLLQPNKGKIEYNGTDVSKRLPSVLSDLFIVPEEFILPPIPLKRYMSINKPF